MSTNQPGGPLRKDPMAGTLDGYTNDLREALAKLDHDRRTRFARPGTRQAALDWFMATMRASADAYAAVTVRTAVKDARATLARRETVITALRGELAGLKLELKAFTLDVTEAGAQLAACQADYEKRIADLRDELTETRATLEGQLAINADREPLPVRQKTAPEVTLEAPAPPVQPTKASGRPRTARTAPKAPRAQSG